MSLQLLFEHFLNCLNTPFRIRSNITAHLDDPIMDYILSQFDSLVPAQKMGFLFSIMPRNALTESVTAKGEMLIERAAKDENELVRLMGMRLQTIKQTNAIDFRVIEREFFDLKVASKKLIPEETLFYSQKALKEEFGVFSVKGMPMKTEIVKEQTLRYAEYGITREKEVLVKRKIKRQSSLFHTAEPTRHHQPSKPAPSTVNKIKTMAVEEAQKIEEATRERTKPKEPKRKRVEVVEEKEKKPKVANIVGGVDVDAVLQGADSLTPHDRETILTFFSGKYIKENRVQEFKLLDRYVEEDGSRKKEGFYIILDYNECKWRKVKRTTKIQ